MEAIRTGARADVEYSSADRKRPTMWERKLSGKYDELNIELQGLQRRQDELQSLVTGKQRIRIQGLHNDFEEMRRLFQEFQEFTCSRLDDLDKRCTQQASQTSEFAEKFNADSLSNSINELSHDLRQSVQGHSDAIAELRESVRQHVPGIEDEVVKLASSSEEPASVEDLLRALRTDQSKLRCFVEDAERAMQKAVDECVSLVEQDSHGEQLRWLQMGHSDMCRNLAELRSELNSVSQQDKLGNVSVATIVPSFSPMRSSPPSRGIPTPSPLAVKVPVSPICDFRGTPASQIHANGAGTGGTSREEGLTPTRLVFPPSSAAAQDQPLRIQGANARVTELTQNWAGRVQPSELSQAGSFSCYSGYSGGPSHGEQTEASRPRESSVDRIQRAGQQLLDECRGRTSALGPRVEWGSGQRRSASWSGGTPVRSELQTPPVHWNLSAPGSQSPSESGFQVRSRPSVIRQLQPAQHNFSPESYMVYDVTLNKTEGTHLGVDTYDGITVANVADGLVSEWNSQNPERTVKAGDRIVEVNGVRDDVRAMRSELQKSQVLHLRFRQASEENLE